MQLVRIYYHSENGAWWAESPDIPNWTAAGDSYDEVREQAREGAAFVMNEGVAIIEMLAGTTPPAELRIISGTASSARPEEPGFWVQGELTGTLEITPIMIVGMPISPSYPGGGSVPNNVFEKDIVRRGSFEFEDVR